MIGLLGDDGKRLCPLCLEEFNLWECRIVPKDSGQVLKPAPVSRLAKLLRQVVHSETLVGKQFVRKLASWECPHCRDLLPYNIDRADSKIITVVGDTGSGKSHFLAVLIRDLEDGLLLPQDRYARFTCLTSDLEQKYIKEYLNPLRNRQPLSPTPPATEDEPYKPLIYEMVVRESPLHPTRVWNLVFYDAAGEDYAIPERMVQFCRYVLEASAIIFLADPMSMPMIYDRLPSHLQNQPFTGRRASAVFNSVIRLFEQSRMGPGSRLLSVPIAITISKSDLLKYLTGINQSYTFSSHPKRGYGNGIDLEDVEIIDAEVRGLLDEYGGRPLLSATQGMNVKFFAASATGHAPKSDGTYAAVDPRRCLDPVLWVLYKLGIIDAN